MHRDNFNFLTSNCTQHVASNGEGYLNDKETEGSGRGILSDSTSVFIWDDWRKLRESSVTIASLRIEFRTSTSRVRGRGTNRSTATFRVCQTIRQYHSTPVLQEYWVNQNTWGYSKGRGSFACDFQRRIPSSDFIWREEAYLSSTADLKNSALDTPNFNTLANCDQAARM
jgi:hypothetical protein